MSATYSVATDGQPRKKMRKGTHSCSECRRRKKSCIPHASNPNTCTECFTRGVQCVDQQPSQPPKRPHPDSKQNLQQRVTELENALQSIVMKLGTSSPPTVEGSDSEAARTLRELRSEVLPSTPTVSSATSPEAPLENAPVLSLFDNSILSRLEDNEDSHAGSLLSPPVSDQSITSSPKLDHIRRTLLSQFPSQSVQDAIMDRSLVWWQTSQDMFPQIYGNASGTSSSNVKQFIAEAKASGSVQTIAKALLCIALSLQEAPPSTYPDLAPSTTSTHLKDKYVNAIDDLVLSDDDIAGTIDGAECLILRAKLEVNDGRIRKAWLLSRKALSISQLLGVHVRPKYSRPSESVTHRGESLWKVLYITDRYISLLLGLPYANSDAHCGLFQPGKISRNPDAYLTGEQYLLRLASIIGHIIDRNQEPPSSDTLPLTVKIEGELTDLAASMPSEWWAKVGKEDEVPSQMYTRIIPQVWYHQARTLLHLPFMLKAAADRRYEYNRVAALESAREMINQYAIFRPIQGFGSMVCKVIDFQAFTAGMVLVLNLLTISPSSSTRDQQEAKEDEELITITTDLLDRASLATDSGVTTQAAKALKMFCKASADPCPHGHTAARVVIPYFGTVVFGPGKSFANYSYLKHPEAVQQSVQLPTPEMETPESLDQNPASFDLYQTTVPADLNFGGYSLQQQQGPGMDGGLFANVNLDLDQDWSWFWNNTDLSGMD